jgi:methionyl aminopeptidase
MAIIMYKPVEVAALKEGGALLSQVLGELAARVEPGITTKELDKYAEKRIRALGGTPSFLNYQSSRRDPPFPATVCISLDEEVVHGIPGARRVEEGMLVKLDIGMWYKGLATDMACTVMVGEVTREKRVLTEVTLEALHLAISKCQAGGWVSDIGKAVDKLVKRQGCSTVKDLVGHGVGKHVHEDPPVPNFFDGSLRPVKLVPGMVLALEPMINAGKDAVDVKDDQWTIYAADMKPSAHFEATVAITEHGTEIVTPIQTGGL